MPSNEEITAALLVLTHEYDLCTEGDMRAITAAMLHAAKLVRDAKYEQEVRKALNPDWENGDEAS